MHELQKKSILLRKNISLKILSTLNAKIVFIFNFFSSQIQVGKLYNLRIHEGNFEMFRFVGLTILQTLRSVEVCKLSAKVTPYPYACRFEALRVIGGLAPPHFVGQCPLPVIFDVFRTFNDRE